MNRTPSGPASRAALPLFLAAALALACSRFPLCGSSIPGPATVAAEITQTFVAGQGQSLDETPTRVSPETPTPGPTPATATVSAASPTAISEVTPNPPTQVSPATPPAEADARPRLAPGQPINLVFINMLDPDRGWGVGHPANDESQYLLGTDDGGQTWVDVSPPIEGGTPWAATTAFLGDTHAWAVFADPAAPPLTAETLVVWHTADAGQTWSASQPLDLSGAEYAAPSSLEFVDALHGWLLLHVGAGMNHDYVMLFHTADGGQTWHRLVDPLATAPDSLPMSCTKTGLDFLNPEAGWVTGDCHGVAPGLFFHTTTSAGQAWQPQPLQAPTGAADLFSNETISCGTYSLTPLPPQFVAVAVICQNLVSGEPSRWLYRSPDAGQTWEADPLPGRDLFFLDSDHVWSVEEGDPNDPTAIRTLYFSDDGGISWANLTTVRWSAQFDFVTPDLGWAIARSGDEIALVRTTNGGASWGLLEPSVGP